MQLLYRLRTGWTGLKFLRLALGVLILYSSIREAHIGGMVLGVLITAFALFSSGTCCGPSGCGMPVQKKSAAKNETIQYEELDDQ